MNSSGKGVDPKIFMQLREYQKTNKLKKEVIKVICNMLNEHEIKNLRE